MPEETISESLGGYTSSESVAECLGYVSNVDENGPVAGI